MDIIYNIKGIMNLEEEFKKISIDDENKYKCEICGYTTIYAAR